MEQLCYAMLYNFFLPCGKLLFFRGSPVFFPGLAWGLAFAWVWVRSCPSLAVRIPCRV
jgi:hypothetical protein